MEKGRAEELMSLDNPVQALELCLEEICPDTEMDSDVILETDSDPDKYTKSVFMGSRGRRLVRKRN